MPTRYLFQYSVAVFNEDSFTSETEEGILFAEGYKEALQIILDCYGEDYIDYIVYLHPTDICDAISMEELKELRFPTIEFEEA